MLVLKIKSIKITDKQINWGPFLGVLWKIALVVPIKDSILASRHFSSYTGSLSNSFLMKFLTFSQISLYFFNYSSSFIKKDIYLVSSMSFLYALIFGRNIHKGIIFFNIFVANKIFKSLFTKRDLIIHNYCVDIYIFYGNRFFMLVKILFLDFNITKFDNFFNFYICFQTFVYFINP